MAVDAPTALEATQVYSPALPAVTGESVREFPSASGMATPPNCHEICGCGLPSATQVNWVWELRGTEMSAGGWRMEGGSEGGREE